MNLSQPLPFHKVESDLFGINVPAERIQVSHWEHSEESWGIFIIHINGNYPYTGKGK